MNDIEVTTQPIASGGLVVAAKFSDIASSHMPEVIFREAARLIAERYVAEHYQEIAALISQDALATLSVAEAAAKVRETLEKKIPDKIMEVTRTRTEVYQRGILGGMTRIR